MSASPPDCDVKTLSVRDARGRRVTMLDPYALCLLRRYDIHGLPTDPADRATVCPECGCAWRLPSA